MRETVEPVGNPRFRIDLRVGAHARIRTGDLLLTKEMLCHLSYVGAAPNITKGFRSQAQSRVLAQKARIRPRRGRRGYRPELTFPTSVMISALPRTLIAAVSAVN